MCAALKYFLVWCAAAACGAVAVNTVPMSVLLPLAFVLAMLSIAADRRRK